MTALRRTLALLFALALLASACGNSDDGGSTSDTTAGTGQDSVMTHPHV